MPETQRIQLVVLDWAGTTVDAGCFAPVVAAVEAFGRCGVEISGAQARAPMGLAKRDHLRAIGEMPEVADRWRDVHGHDWCEDDVERVYAEHFVPLQIESAVRHCELVDGLVECVDALRARGLRIATSTGYFQAVADQIYAAAARQGYRPDFNICADEVPAGRPAPWMIFRAMQALGVFPPARVVAVGDTVPDIQAGCHAGAWSVGVTHTGSDVGCTAGQLAALPASERSARIERAAAGLREAGAHFVVDSIADLPDVIDGINDRLRAGDKP